MATLDTPAALNGDGFSTEQKEYLSGFTSGLSVSAQIQGLSGGAKAAEMPSGPDKLALEATQNAVAEGKKLCPEEEMKRAKHPLDRWDDLQTHAAENRFPKGTDVLAWKFHGLFYVAPAQDSFMCRLRFYGGLADARKFQAVADLAERFGGGYADLTTRANLQIRELGAAQATDFLIELQETGLVARRSGADNIRNVTGSPTARFDAQELFDTRGLCREMHFHILNRREMYGLPRKFNIAFDSGGSIAALEETNDIGFSAVKWDDKVGSA